jgi:DNA-binding transcriptional ArsR family regulator
LPASDTPGAKNPVPDGLSRAAAEAAWRSVTPSIAGIPHIRISKDGGRTFPARHARPLPAVPPGQPCTVPVFDPASATGRMLALDLDSSRGDVARAAAELAALLARLGARQVADVSPSGGVHLLVLFAAPLPWLELRDLVRAMSLRFPVIDPAPMCSLGGQIAPPGSRHKSGGWRTLSVPLSEVRSAVEHPNGPEAWNALLTEFAAELQRVDGKDAGPASPAAGAELDDSGAPWAPRLGGRAPLGAETAQIARTGRWDRSHYPGRSEARMAVLAAAAARGWRMADIRAAIASGAWRGFPALYERRSEPGRMDRLLPREWRKSVALVTGGKNVRGWHTSNTKHAPLPAPAVGADEYGMIRQWMTAVGCALEDPQRVRGWEGRVITVRLVLLALAQAAMVSGSAVTEFGTRNLALHATVSHRTVARVLRMLRDEPDPLIDLVSPGRMARADRYQLRIPAAYAASVQWRRRRAGRIEAAHPAFLVLGGPAALVYDALGRDEARGAEMARVARLSPSAASAALRVLAGHGLAERGRRGWRRGPAGLDAVAEAIGAAGLHRERAERYAEDRETWRARLRQYASVRNAVIAPGDDWTGPGGSREWPVMPPGRWPALAGDFARGPPTAVALTVRQRGRPAFFNWRRRGGTSRPPRLRLLRTRARVQATARNGR